MAENFTDALAFVLENEGGWYPGDQPRDPNPTMYGVTQRTYDAFRAARHQPPRSVRLIAQDELRSVYVDYWGEAGCPYTGPLTAVTLFDMSVNAGQGTARRLLQLALGVTPDGVIGPDTENAIGAADDTVLATAYCDWRDAHYRRTAQDPRLAPNLDSWLARVNKFRQRYLGLPVVA